MLPLIWAEIAPCCQTKISLGDRQTSGWGILDDQMCFPTLVCQGILVYMIPHLDRSPGQIFSLLGLLLHGPELPLIPY